MSSVRGQRLISVAFLLTLCLLLPGCKKSKVTKENFDKITNGMTLDQVEDILGKGEKETGDGSNVAAQVGIDVSGPPSNPGADTYVWEKGNKKITVHFMNKKVANKQQSGL